MFTWSILKTNRGGIWLRSSEFLYLLFFREPRRRRGGGGRHEEGCTPVMKMPCLKMSPQRQRFVFSLRFKCVPTFYGRLLFIYAVYCLFLGVIYFFCCQFDARVILLQIIHCFF